MNEKDKLFRTIRRLLVIGAISLGALFVFVIIGYAVLRNRHAEQFDNVVPYKMESFYEDVDNQE